MYIKWLDSVGMKDVALVGGKNASCGELIRTLKDQGIQVPDGFATTSAAYNEFIASHELKKKILFELHEFKHQHQTLEKTGKNIRHLIELTPFSPAFVRSLKRAYAQLAERVKKESPDVAVRSSATAEDLPTASFAGQLETLLNVRGEEDLLDACHKCYASLFTDRAIAYREAKGFDHMKIAVSVGVQQMVRADKGGAGVLFTLDPESGFRSVIVINASWGLGENVVQGSVIPDEYILFKPLLNKKNVNPILDKVLGKKEKKLVYASKRGHTKNTATTSAERASFVLSDKEIHQLAKWGALIEKHYKKPMDVEWAKDGKTGVIYIVQARPETVQSQKKPSAYKSYTLKGKGKKLLSGLAIGEAIVTAKPQVILSIKDIGKFQPGSILVTKMTSPDWVPIMKRAAGIITDLGGRTSHAAIVSRELGIPALVGTEEGTHLIKKIHSPITLSCAEGSRGFVYEGALAFEAKDIDLEKLPTLKTQIMLNISSPEEAFRWWHLPVQGIGLARMEFIINTLIKIHPMALVHPDQVKDRQERAKIEELTKQYRSKKEYFIDHLSRGIAKIAASRYPDPVIVRMSDFKTNEYADLIGGKDFEPKEENPMLGFRGASRYYSDRYREGFALECASIVRVREEMGLSNVVVMIPFCRTLEEADKVLAVMASYGLRRGHKGLEVYVMCEIPSNVILVDAFADRFDGFSIGSNDLTQLLLGVDRDSNLLAPLFDERNAAVKKSIQELIKQAKKKKRKTGICGQAPSDYPDFAAFLVHAGIDSISLNPDSVINTIKRLSKLEH